MSFFSAVIGDGHTEFTVDSANQWMPKHMIGLRINDITSGTALQLEDMDGTSIVYNGLAVGDELVGQFRRTLAAGTTLDEIVVFHVL